MKTFNKRIVSVIALGVLAAISIVTNNLELQTAALISFSAICFFSTPNSFNRKKLNLWCLSSLAIGLAIYLKGSFGEKSADVFIIVMLIWSTLHAFLVFLNYFKHKKEIEKT